MFQCVNAVVLLLSVYYQFWPNVWLVFVMVLYEGLLGGAAYVNIFYLIRVKVRAFNLFIMTSEGCFVFLHHKLFRDTLWGFVPDWRP